MCMFTFDSVSCLGAFLIVCRVKLRVWVALGNVGRLGRCTKAKFGLGTVQSQPGNASMHAELLLFFCSIKTYFSDIVMCISVILCKNTFPCFRNVSWKSSAWELCANLGTWKRACRISSFQPLPAVKRGFVLKQAIIR